MKIFCFEGTGEDLICELVGNNNVSINPTVDDWNQETNRIVLYTDLETQIQLSINNKSWFFKYLDKQKVIDHEFCRFVSRLRTNNNSYLPTSIADLTNQTIPLAIAKELIEEHGFSIKQIIDFDIKWILKKMEHQVGINWLGETIFSGYKYPVDIDAADQVYDLYDIIADKAKDLFGRMKIDYNQQHCTQIINNWCKSQNLINIQ